MKADFGYPIFGPRWSALAIMATHRDPADSNWPIKEAGPLDRTTHPIPTSANSSLKQRNSATVRNFPAPQYDPAFPRGIRDRTSAFFFFFFRLPR